MKLQKLILPIVSLCISLSANAAIILSGDVYPSDLSTNPTTYASVVVGGVFTASTTGSVTIDSGSVVSTQSPQPFGSIANKSGSTGTVTVSGTDGGSQPSTWQLLGTQNGSPTGQAAYLAVGVNGSGVLNVKGGALVKIDSQGATTTSPSSAAGFQVGRYTSGKGTINLSDPNTTLSVISDFGQGLVGRAGEGEMNITGGATLKFTGKNTFFNIATAPAGISDNKGTLNVKTGGSVVGPLFMNVGGSPGADGTLNLDGPNSSVTLKGICQAPCPSNFAPLDQGGFLTVGEHGGHGTVNITNGAEFLIDSSGIASVKYPGFSLGGSPIVGPEGTGSLTVQGSGSELLVKGNQGFFVVGRLDKGTGILTISDGGKVIMQNGDDHASGYIADRSSATGTILVDGASSLLEAGSYLGVGLDENRQNAGTGFLILNNGGAVKADQISTGASGYIEGSGTLQGQVLVNGGTVSASVSVAPPKSEKINAGVSGHSQSSGSLPSKMLLKSGTLASGDPPGTININGDFTMNSGVLVIEIAGTAPGQYDVLNVSGNTDIEGGTIKFVFIGGYLPQQGQSVQFLQGSGSVTVGPNVTETYQGAAPGFQFVAKSVPSQSGSGLEFVALNTAYPVGFAPIPTLSYGAMVLLTLLLAGIALSQLRRRRKA